MNPQRILRQKLEDLQRAGVTHVPNELMKFVDALAEAANSGNTEPPTSNLSPAGASRVSGTQPPKAASTATASSDIAATVKADPPTEKSRPAATATASTASVARQFLPSSSGSLPREFAAGMTDIKRPCSTLSRDERNAGLSTIAQQVAVCTRCQELAETRTQTVFGVGNPEADIMYIGEAPGADEDRQGEPFVGKAGQLLDKITAACKLTREEIYICNILRCRPPGNRNPTPGEAANCREYLDAQIEAVDPKYIVCWGSVAAHNLLDTKAAIGKMRGKFFDYKGIKVLCTYHPSYLLRSPGAKKDVWTDMKLFRADMGVILD
jgi:uracil-DNA glycosylase